MPDIVVDGVKYVPAGQDAPTGPPRIGVGVTTHNRPEVLKKALDAWGKYLPDGAVFVLIDDASDTPVPEATYRFDENVGIARAKNRAIADLVDAGCEHLFLFDDDTYPKAADWWRPYVESPEPHLMYAWGDIHYQTPGLLGYQWPKGCMLYTERRVIDRVGGMDPGFGLWGCEHASWSDRIHNAGFTTCRYQDVPGSHDLIQSLDRWGEVETSAPLAARLAANTGLLAASRYSDAYIPYREERARHRFDLSILIPSTHTRRVTFLPKILEQVYGQYEALPAHARDRVEILTLVDTKHLTLGEKRNRMVDLAQGEYVVHVDDDDRIEPDYITTLLAATRTGKDALTFKAAVSINGARPRDCIYSTRYTEDANTKTEYHRLPNHITAVRRELAIQAGFPNKRVGEDSAYAAALRPLLRSEHHIDRVLYHYDYSDATTETQAEANEAITTPVVDIVVLSKGSTPDLRDMAQHTIDTAIAGAGDHTVNVVVVEQEPGVRYRDAITLHEPGAFAYNRFANRAAQTGKAPWIMVANSDLEFHPGWLDALLAADHPIVSPRCPREGRQNVARNELGDVNGKHLSGWCFMIARDLWEKIGGLDEDFTFWCADNAVIEQVKAAGVQPMLVPAAKVTHLISRTIGGTAKADDPGDDGSMTWALVRRFNAKYGRTLFAGDRRYVQWQAAHPEKAGAR